MTVTCTDPMNSTTAAHHTERRTGSLGAATSASMTSNDQHDRSKIFTELLDDIDADD